MVHKDLGTASEASESDNDKNIHTRAATSRATAIIHRLEVGGPALGSGPGAPCAPPRSASAKEGGGDAETVRAEVPRWTRASESTQAQWDRRERDDRARASHPGTRHKRLDAIANEDVQRLKTWLGAKAPKTVNNVLAVLSVLFKKAVEWNVIERMPCSIRLLPTPKSSTAFYDFDEYERLGRSSAEH